MTEDLMKTKDVLEYLKISRSTLYRLIKEGKLAPIKMGPKTLRYRRSDVDQLVEAGRTER